MVVIMMERVTASLRGEITRWLIELRPGIFVGNVSALVRDKLWELICKRMKNGAVTLLHNASNEQGYKIKQYGDTGRTITDFEGLQLITIPEKNEFNKNSDT